jgi:hypothetical protein
MRPEDVVSTRIYGGALQDVYMAMDRCRKMPRGGHVFLLVPHDALVGAWFHAAHAWSSALQHDFYLYVRRIVSLVGARAHPVNI